MKAKTNKLHRKSTRYSGTKDKPLPIFGRGDITESIRVFWLKRGYDYEPGCGFRSWF